MIKRKDIRKALKKWVDREECAFNYLLYTFIDTGVGGSKMNKTFESLVDEVYKLTQKGEI